MYRLKNRYFLSTTNAHRPRFNQRRQGISAQIFSLPSLPPPAPQPWGILAPGFPEPLAWKCSPFMGFLFSVTFLSHGTVRRALSSIRNIKAVWCQTALNRVFQLFIENWLGCQSLITMKPWLADTYVLSRGVAWYEFSRII